MMLDILIWWLKQYTEYINNAKYMNLVLRANVLQNLTQVAIFQQVVLVCGILIIAHVFESLGMLSITMMSFVPLFRLGNTGDCGNSGSGTGSTPFIYTWNGESFQLENDFLLGEPTTFYKDPVAGRKAYEEGKTGPDLYHIRNPFSLKNGKIAFQIKEIEAEESFIDYISLTRVVYPRTGKLVVDSRHNTFHIFSKRELSRREGVVQQDIFIKGEKAPVTLGNLTRLADDSASEDKGHMLEIGDTIEINGKVGKTKAPLFLLLGSRYRDWTAEKTSKFDATKSVNGRLSPFFKKESVLSVRGFGQMTLLLLLGAAVWAFGVAGKLVRSDHEGGPDIRMLKDSFGIQMVQADDPSGGGCSLLIESYWDWDEGAFQLSETIHPRHSQYSVDAVSLPSKAISATGEVRIRITATKRHYVNVISLFAPRTQMSFETENLAANKVFHQRLKKDYSKVTEAKHSGEYLHTIPSDIVDVEFEQPSRRAIHSDEQDAHLVHATGFYTSLSEEGREKAGNWVERLDPKERELLKDMYPLEEYHKRDRTPALS